jgi:hypothetical protein
MLGSPTVTAPTGGSCSLSFGCSTTMATAAGGPWASSADDCEFDSVVAACSCASPGTAPLTTRGVLVLPPAVAPLCPNLPPHLGQWAPRRGCPAITTQVVSYRLLNEYSTTLVDALTSDLVSSDTLSFFTMPIDIIEVRGLGEEAKCCPSLGHKRFVLAAKRGLCWRVQWPCAITNRLVLAGVCPAVASQPPRPQQITPFFT